MQVSASNKTLLIVGGIASTAVLGGFIWTYWSNRNRKPTYVYKNVLPPNLPVHLVDTYEEAEVIAAQLLQELHNSKFPVIGLDCEWKPNKTKGRSKVALLQVSSDTRCVLFHLIHMKRRSSRSKTEENEGAHHSGHHELDSRYIPNSLAQLLSDHSILKVGVGILQDVRLLFTDYGIEVRSTVDLQSVSAKYNYNVNGSGLSSLSSTVLNINIDKSYYLRCSNWEKQPLSDNQKRYAATDAWIAEQIFRRIYERHIEDFRREILLVQDPEELQVEEENRGKEEENGEEEKMKEVGESGIHVPHKEEKESVLFFASEYIDRKPIKMLGSGGKGGSGRVKKEVKIPTRKCNLYENCRMLSPDGVLLCTCNKKKIKWYLDRDIADLVCEDPPTIKLRFTPNGAGHANDKYYLSEKENRCVVCGKYEELVRHSVIPHGYRSNFEEKYKSRSSHDIVLLCKYCLERASQEDARFKAVLASELGFPLSGSGEKEIIDEELKEVKAKTRLLSSPKHKLPPARVEEISRLIADYLHKEPEELTQEDYAGIIAREHKRPNPEFRSHEELVVEYVSSDITKLEQFIKSWRRHFQTTMRPQYLSPHWSVDHPIQNIN